MTMLRPMLLMIIRIQNMMLIMRCLTQRSLSGLCAFNVSDAFSVWFKKNGLSQVVIMLGIFVKIDGQWYNLDPTWGAGSEGNYHYYYLKSGNAFSDHYRKEKYKTEAFYAQFSMSLISYDEEVEETPIYLQDLDFGTLTSTTGEAICYQQLEGKSRIYLFFCNGQPGFL